MELLMVNSAKLKITLTALDMKKLNITADELDYDSTSTKRAFWDILDKAKTETGFDSSRCKLYVQVYPSKDGGCEMYVTKFPESEDVVSAQIGSLSEKSLITPQNKTDVHKGHDVICVVENDEALFSLCKRLQSEGFSGNSSIYSQNGGKYYLVLENKTRLPSFIQSKYASSQKNLHYLNEYCDVFEATEERLAYLKEYFDKIANESAVSLFASIFK